jgi:RNA polymerase sigma factor (sigma-70 family)
MEVSALSHPGRIPGLHGPSALLRLQSDERLIALTRRGHHAAFEVLCARYNSRLLSFCRHMLGSREDAEDVLQEVFAAAFNAVLADERAINVRPWLYRIARNRSLNHLRRASAIGVDSMDIHYAEHGISTGEKVMRRESFRELLADVHQLPETQRTALLLREIDALSYEQIAHAMETTVPSVKSLLVRARISLAEAAEARKLSCEEVRHELGEVAEGLAKLSSPARRHVRGCERCSFFRKQLKDNNHALALIMPVGPLLLAKKLLLAKLGITASAGGAHVASAGGATVGASASAGAGAAAAGAASGGGVAGGLVTVGAGALATKAAIVTAAAAIVTAGAVAADHSVAPAHHRPLAVAGVPAANAYSDVPLVVRQAPQPVSAGAAEAHAAAAGADESARRHRHRAAAGKDSKTPAVPPAGSGPSTLVPAGADATTTTAGGTSTNPAATAAPATKPANPQTTTEVTSATTELPAAATSLPNTGTTSTTSTAGGGSPEGEAPSATTTTTTPAPATADGSAPEEGAGAGAGSIPKEEAQAAPAVETPSSAPAAQTPDVVSTGGTPIGSSGGARERGARRDGLRAGAHRRA